MLESQEQIELTLDLCGEDIVFPSVTLKGIPGHVVGNVQNFDSVYDIDKQDLYWQMSSKQILSNWIKEKDSFKYSLNGKSYTFEILSIIDDLLGWVEVRVKVLEVFGV